MASFTNNANFSQRQFQIPIQETPMGSPTGSYIGSQASSNELPQNQYMNQVNQTDTSGNSRRAFSFSSMSSKLPGFGKKPAEPKASGDKVEKVPKRRGPKPDSKPAQNRRQELNRAAQRTHRERKENYVKDLERQVQQSKETIAQKSREKKEAESRWKARESEFRSQMEVLHGHIQQLTQLLTANKVPFYLTETLSNSQTMVKNTSTDDSVADNNLVNDAEVQMTIPNYQYVPNTYTPSQNQADSIPQYQDPIDGYAQNHGNMSNYAENQYQTGYSTENYGNAPVSCQGTASAYATSDNIGLANYAPAQTSAIASPDSTYSSSNAGNTFAASPTHGLSMSPDGYQPFQFQTSLFPTHNVLSPALRTPDDPRFINFVMDLEDTCKPHANIVMKYLADAEAMSGHALMLSARPLEGNPGEYHTVAPVMANSDLNQMIMTGRRFNEDAEIKPQDAVQIIIADRRSHLLTDEEFAVLQAKLKAKSRCYGFGASLEDFEVRDALDEVCTKYGEYEHRF